MALGSGYYNNSNYGNNPLLACYVPAVSELEKQKNLTTKAEQQRYLFQDVLKGLKDTLYILLTL